MPTLERTAYVRGLFTEFREQFTRYHGMLKELLELEARVEMSERALRMMRAHVVEAVEECECKPDELPKDAEIILQGTRFVGRRVADACLEVLREKKRLTMAELLTELNGGQFRFRTNSPEREINAALLRQPNVRREDEYWVYERPAVVKPRRPKETAA